jgi:phosphoribosylglycinamide formyltransferase-1
MTAARMVPRLGILLSGAGSTYANLETAIAEDRLRATIAVVVSSRPDAGGLALAARHGRRAVVAVGAEAVAAALREHRAEAVAMCGYMKFWDPPADFAERVFNIHPSLLPAFGGRGMYGLRVHQAVLASGATISGCTVHRVAGPYDSGPIVAQREVPVLPGDSPHDLQERVQAAERALYPAALQAALHPG